MITVLIIVKHKKIKALYLIQNNFKFYFTTVPKMLNKYLCELFESSIQ